jgi:hypothetical protein
VDEAQHFIPEYRYLIVAMDHKPLLKVLSDRKMEDIKNPHLYNLKENMLPFHLCVTHVPVKKHLMADAMACYTSVGTPTPN